MKWAALSRPDRHILKGQNRSDEGHEKRTCTELQDAKLKRKEVGFNTTGSGTKDVKILNIAIQEKPF